MTVHLSRTGGRYLSVGGPGMYRWQRSASQDPVGLSWIRGVETRDARVLVRPRKKPPGRYFFESNRVVRFRDLEYYHAIDYVPWEIHAIEDEIAYASALCSYLKSVEITVDLDSGVLDWPPFRSVTECSGSAKKKLPRTTLGYVQFPKQAILRFPTGEHLKYEIKAWLT